MNSYNKPHNMSYKGTRMQAMPAPKLMAIENEYHRTKDALVHEIKRLRGEVGMLAKRYNNAKWEINDLVKRVRSQPPPPIPKRDDEIEKKIEERHKRWKLHLQREMEKEEEKEKEREKNNDTVMPIAKIEVESPIETLSPDPMPLDQSPQSEVISSKVQSSVSTPPPSDKNEDAGMEDVQEKKRVTVQAIFEGEGWEVEMRKKDMDDRFIEYAGKAKRWEESCKLMKIGEDEMGLEGDLDEVSDRMLDIVDEWNEAKRKGKFRGWGNLKLLDGMLYAKKKLRWRVVLEDDGLRFEE